MNRQFLKNSLLTASIIGLASLTSCEPDDVCLPTDAPFVTVELKYTDSITELKDSIYFEAFANDTLLIGQGNVLNKSTFNLPIQITETNTIKYVLRQGKNYRTKQIIGTDTIYTEHIAPIDVVYINYTFDNKYDSKGCGFGIYFKDASVNATSNNWIKGIETVNNTIDNATSTNFIIFAEPRSN